MIEAPSTITVTTPSHAEGCVTVAVHSPDGEVDSRASAYCYAAQVVESIVLSNEGPGGLLTRLAALGYGSYSLHDALSALRALGTPSLAPAIPDRFLDALATLPPDSAPFTSTLSQFTAPDTAVALALDGAVHTVPLRAADHEGRIGTLLIDSQPYDLRFVHASAPEFPLTSWSPPASAVVYHVTAIGRAWPAEPAFTDDPLIPRLAPIRARHLVELRHWIDAARARRALPPFAWSDPTIVPGSALVLARHVAEMRTAVAEVQPLPLPGLPAYSEPALTAGRTPIRAADIAELRTAVRAIWQQGPQGGGPGRGRIRSFVVSRASHPLITPGPIEGDSDETPGAVRIVATLPGGTASRITAILDVSGGRLTLDGQPATSPLDLDLSRPFELAVVDEEGVKRVYQVDVRDSGLPSVFVRTKGAAPIVSKTDYIKGEIAILGGDCTYAVPLALRPMRIRGRGNSTWSMPKKPYRISLDSAASVLGLPAARTWVLLANYADKSLVRNHVAFDSARSLSHLRFTPDSLPVDLWVNGQYQGTYALGSQVEVGTGRVAIEAPGSDPDTAFFLEVNMRSPEEGGVEGVDYFVLESGLILDIKSPKPEDATEEQRTSIQAFVQQVEHAALASAGFEALVDVDAFIDWLIAEEVFKNVDSDFRLSVFAYKDRGGRLGLGPVWDFDLACGNSNYGEADGYPLASPQGWLTSTSAWMQGLLANPGFRSAFVARWRAVRDPLRAAAVASVDRTVALIDRSQRENFRRWPILGTYVWPNPPELVSADTWPKQVTALRDWIDARFLWLDQAVAALDASSESVAPPPVGPGSAPRRPSIGGRGGGPHGSASGSTGRQVRRP